MTEYVATTSHGWARGWSEDSAIIGCVNNTKPDDDDTVKMWLWSVTGFETVWPGGISAEQVHYEEQFELTGEQVNRLRETYGILELEIEEVCIEARVDVDE